MKKSYGGVVINQNSLETTNTTGKKRDLRLLKAAFELLHSTTVHSGGLVIP